MINRTKYSIANFKMNKTNSDVENYLNVLYKLGSISSDISKHRIVICPPFTSLSIDDPAAKLTITKKLFALGAQNISSYENGAYTGEISALMVTRTDTYFINLS